MSAAQKNIWKSNWTRCNSRGHSAARIVNYLLRRPDDKARPTRDARWSTIPDEHQVGDARAFKEAADRRKAERLRSARARGKDIEQDHSRKNVQYLHVIISPRSREDFAPEDFRALVEPWVRDARAGCTYEHFGAIHYDDPEGPTLHLVVARDKLKDAELEAAKERGDELVEERERMIDLDRELEQERQLEEDREPSAPGHGRGRGRAVEDLGRARDRDEDLDMDPGWL